MVVETFFLLQEQFYIKDFYKNIISLSGIMLLRIDMGMPWFFNSHTSLLLSLLGKDPQINYLFFSRVLLILTYWDSVAR